MRGTSVTSVVEMGQVCLKCAKSSITTKHGGTAPRAAKLFGTRGVPICQAGGEKWAPLVE